MCAQRARFIKIKPWAKRTLYSRMACPQEGRCRRLAKIFAYFVQDFSGKALMGTDLPMFINFVLVAAAYLLGSVSSAVITCKLMGLPNPREQGSGNPGTTNVLRIGGKKAAFFTLTGDMLKGLVPVVMANALSVNDFVLGAVALAAVLGHLYPLFFGFQGGKGVATTWGGLLGIHWGLGLVWALTWLLAAAWFRISSLAALIATTITPLYTYWLLNSPWLILLNSIMAGLIIWRHRTNIRNLIDGTESRIGSKT
jgi:glycerol-3-phosphate acyltransferase PlsY